MKSILIAGAGGFVGGHLAKKLSNSKTRVICVDKKPLTKWYQIDKNNKNISIDLSSEKACQRLTKNIDHVYNLACDMGGVGFIEVFKAQCMLSVLINTNLVKYSQINGVKKYFFASSACIYPKYKQLKNSNFLLKENDAYPAEPMDGYGWEKLFGERLCENYRIDHGLNVRVARFHNTFGPNCSWNDGREKAPAALARKFIEAKFSKKHKIKIWGDGKQKRSYTYIDDCITGVQKLLKSSYCLPINLGSSHCVTVNELVDILEEISGIKVKREYIKTAPTGVESRNSDNKLIKEILKWEPKYKLEKGMLETYTWIYDQFKSQHNL